MIFPTKYCRDIIQILASNIVGKYDLDIVQSLQIDITQISEQLGIRHQISGQYHIDI